MIPELYSRSGWALDTVGYGMLAEAISCFVTEQRNGEYELAMVYPTTGKLFKFLDTETIILAKPNEVDDPQPFRVYKVSMAINGKVAVNAHHLSYELSGIPVKAVYAVGIQDAIAKLRANSLVTNRYTLTTDIENTTSIMKTFPIRSYRACLGGEEGSLLDVFGGAGTGEFHFDMFDIRFLRHRGSDNGVWIAYGKNMTNFVKEISTENVYSGVIAYWNDTEAAVYSDIQYVSNHLSYAEKIFLLDLSSDYETSPSKEELNRRAVKYRDDNDIGTPKQTLQISLVQLRDTLEYKDISSAFEHIALCDTVTVFYPQFNVNVKMKVIEMTYDSLNERIVSVTLGNAKSSLAGTIKQQIDETVQKSKVKESAFYVAENSAVITSSLIGKYGSYTFDFIKNGLMRPFGSAGPGASFDLTAINSLDSSVNTVLVITSHNSTPACNTMWIVRRSSNNAFQIGGTTGAVTVSCTGGTIHVASTGANVNAYFLCLDGMN